MILLQKNEWPKAVRPLLDPNVYELALAVRTVADTPMVPSPDPEAHVRYTDGASLHCVGVRGNKRSMATDLFLLDPSGVAQAWVQAQSISALGGFGIYFDTSLGGKKRVLFHLDTRQKRTLWLCPDERVRRYVYYSVDPILFLNLLSKEFSKL